jgi:predicted enzyme related to lactoylglutathione lyase
MERARRIGGVFLRADNPQALSRWYADHLGVDATREDPQGIALFAVQPGRTASELSLEVDDLDAMVDQLRAAGVHVDVDENWHADGRFAHLHDPAGNPVQLCQPTDSSYVRTLEDDELPPEQPARRLTARWLALAMGVLIAVVLAVVTQRSDNPEAAPDDSPATTTTTAEPTTTTTSPTKPVTTDAGRLAVRGDWEIFAYGAGELVRIDLARGRITRTPIPNAELTSEGPTSLVVGPDSVLVHSWDGGNVELVVDGRPASPQPDWLQAAGGGRVLPGPKPGQLWLEEHRLTDVVLKPVTMRGTRVAGRTITMPQNFWVQSSDQRGNLIASGVGGAYLVDQDGMHRITTGALVAVGPSRFLTHVCDERARCRLEVVDRSTGAGRPLGRDLERSEMINAGLISANGKTAAVMSSGPDGEQLQLVDLGTGAARQVDVEIGEVHGALPMAWSPDGRWLLAVSGGDGLVVVDPATARVRPLGVELSAVEAVAVRE